METPENIVITHETFKHQPPREWMVFQQLYFQAVQILIPENKESKTDRVDVAFEVTNRGEWVKTLTRWAWFAFLADDLLEHPNAGRFTSQHISCVIGHMQDQKVISKQLEFLCSLGLLQKTPEHYSSLLSGSKKQPSRDYYQLCPFQTLANLRYRTLILLQKSFHSKLGFHWVCRHPKCSMSTCSTFRDGIPDNVYLMDPYLVCQNGYRQFKKIEKPIQMADKYRHEVLNHLWENIQKSIVTIQCIFHYRKNKTLSSVLVPTQTECNQTYLQFQQAPSPDQSLEVAKSYLQIVDKKTLKIENDWALHFVFEQYPDFQLHINNMSYKTQNKRKLNHIEQPEDKDNMHVYDEISEYDNEQMTPESEESDNDEYADESFYDDTFIPDNDYSNNYNDDYD